MGEYVVKVVAEYIMTAEIEAKNIDEARRKAENLEPEDFIEFYDFYEWLGSKWEELEKKVYPKGEYGHGFCEVECQECGNPFKILRKHEGVVTCPYCGSLVED